MTDQDRQYMVDVDDENLRAFLNWHDDARRRGVLNVSFYAILKMCWMAARNSIRQPELAPSRDVLPPAPPPQRRSLNPEFELRVRPGEQVRFTGPPPEPFAHQVRGSGQSAATVPGAQAMNWPQRTQEDHRQAQRYVETQAMPALRDDPFARVRLSGPQQAALDRMYPEPGFTTLDMPVTMREMPVLGPVENVGDHRRQQMEARYAGLADYGPGGPVMTPLQALPEPEDGA